MQLLSYLDSVLFRRGGYMSEFHFKDWLESFYEILMSHQHPWSVSEYIFIYGIEGLLLLTVLWLKHRKKITLFQGIGFLLLWMYMAVVLESCVFGRAVILDGPQINLDLFYSWQSALNGSSYFLEQVVLNILLLVPFGMLLPVCRGRPIRLDAALGIGFLFSLLIESLQYILARGVFELDDLMDNTLGCLLGALAVNGIWILIRLIRSLYLDVHHVDSRS